MRRLPLPWIVSLGLVLVIASATAASGVPPRDPPRVDAARRASEPRIRARFADAQVAYPAPELFLRAFKEERELELWAGEPGKPLRQVATFPVCALSGVAGPKRRQGDGQVPEGFYVIDRFNPQSNFHLSVRVSYPNASDTARGSKGQLGGDIYVHGNCVSIGCLALGDGAIEELYLALWDTHRAFGRSVPVHIFPNRLDAKRLARATPVMRAFWEELLPGYQVFETTRRVPRVQIDAAGAYRVVP